MSTFLLQKPSLEDIHSKTVRLIGQCQDLGSLSSGNLVIAIADLQEGLVAADVLRAYNYADDEVMSVSVSGSDLVFDSSTALTATKLVEIIIRLK